MEPEKRDRINKAWNEVADMDDLSNEEIVQLVAQRAGVLYGEAREILCFG